ncbi:MAG: cysteine desulfurase family protein [Patescibacteria group bacterium]
MNKIYLDNSATTRVDPRVLDAMLLYFTKDYGNASSLHQMGQDALVAIEEARKKVATVIGATPEQIFFTNSATEANNIILRQRWHTILTTNTEHSSVEETIKFVPLVYDKSKKDTLNVKKDGTIDLKKLKKKIESERYPDLVSIIAANNEIGTIHSLYEIGNICREQEVMFHTDATQAIGKVPINVADMNLFALTLSGHKIYGPKGVGALYVQEPKSLYSFFTHGGYQNTFISGTQNTPAIVGLGKACEILDFKENDRIKELRDGMLDFLLSKIEGSYVNGTMENRLCNNISISIPGIDGRAFAIALGENGVMVSGGAACNSLNPKPSHVLKAIKCPDPNSAIRISLGRFNTEEEIKEAQKIIVKMAKKMRS